MPLIAQLQEIDAVHTIFFVVHGHGDLRRAVRLALDDEPMVVRYEDADAASGGAGCTVVYLK